MRKTWKFYNELQEIDLFPDSVEKAYNRAYMTNREFENLIKAKILKMKYHQVLWANPEIELYEYRHIKDWCNEQRLYCYDGEWLLDDKDERWEEYHMSTDSYDWGEV